MPSAEIRWLLAEGYQPVLAHPERYLYLTMEDYRLLKEAGAQFQRNLGTLEGMYGEAVSVRAEALEAEGMYDWLGVKFLDGLPGEGSVLLGDLLKRSHIV